MSTVIASDAGERLAVVIPETGTAQCLFCATPVQRTPTGDLAAGVRAHVKTVHPEKRL